MAHPYNQSQHVYVNYTGARGAGTDIQPKLFYGSDYPETDFRYTGKAYPTFVAEYRTSFTYPSGDFFPNLIDDYGLDARNPTGIFQGATIDRPSLEESFTGEFYGLFLDYPNYWPTPSGKIDRYTLENIHAGVGDIAGSMRDHPREYPVLDNATPSSGNMYGFKNDVLEGTYAYLEGELYKGRIEHQFEFEQENMDYPAQFFFYTGRCQGSIS